MLWSVGVLFWLTGGAGEAGDSPRPPQLMNLQLCPVLWFLADRQSEEMAVQSAGNYSPRSSILTGVCVCVHTRSPRRVCVSGMRLRQEE